MGKLTYINRKIDGSKLAQVVARDIIKRLPPNGSYKAALRDPIAEFDISGKAVEDEGLYDISKALVTAVNHGNPSRILILEEVSLKGNKLGALGVSHLAPVIKASSSELRNLDLSENAIKIINQEDAVAWEKFLMSFSRCTTLRRLDLSGNKLSRKGFEILSKVYAAEEGILVRKETGEARLCGLQSIPYICLADTGLDDICSTYLSYVLESHKFVSDLLPIVPQAKAGAQTHQLEVLDEIQGCDGLIWKPNQNLTTHGTKMLELVEAARKARNDLQEHDAGSIQLNQSINELEVSTLLRSPIEKKTRRDSVISIDDSFHINSSHLSSDLIRARSRIQLEMLRNDGVAQNELWAGAFRMLKYTRVILFASDLDSHSARLSMMNKPMVDRTTVTSQGQVDATPLIQPPVWPSLPTRSTSTPTPNLTLRIVQPGTQTRSALAKADPNIPVTTRDTSVKNAKSGRARSRRNLPKQRIVEDLLSSETKSWYNRPYKSTLPAGFPEDAWIAIISHAAVVEDILSGNQKTSVAKWGSSRHAMQEMIAWRRKHESQQVYKALEGMGCLAYGI